MTFGAGKERRVRIKMEKRRARQYFFIFFSVMCTSQCIIIIIIIIIITIIIIIIILNRFSCVFTGLQPREVLVLYITNDLLI